MNKGKILLVDDNLDMLLIGQRIFTRAGYEFLSARSGQEGLDKADSEKPDVIILDYILPDINGTQFIKYIWSESKYKPIRRTPIVILTARTEYIENLEMCFSMGLKAFLNKPFGHRELVNVIDNIIQVEKYKSSQKSEPKKVKPTVNQKQIDEEWLEDLQIAADTIATLCQNLSSKKADHLTEEQRLDLQAIYTSSKRLLLLLKKMENPPDVINHTSYLA